MVSTCEYWRGLGLGAKGLFNCWGNNLHNGPSKIFLQFQSLVDF